MSNTAQALIDDMVDELVPVRSLRTWEGIGVTLLLAAGAMAVVATSLGVRGDLRMGIPDAMFFIRSGVLVILGMATAFAVVNMARPGVGNSNQGWIWAFGAASLFPLTALIMSAVAAPPIEALRPAEGLKCLMYSSMAAIGIGTGLTLWLRQGAATSLERAGWLVGTASGALGAAAYNIYCPFNDIYYVGVWFTLPVIISAFVGRAIVPALIRW